MVTPRKEEILEKAIEMWFQWQVRQGFTPPTLPEETELKKKENVCPWTGKTWWETARDELMKSAETKALDEEIAFVEKEYSEAVERIKEKALEEAEKDKRELEKRIKNLEKSRDEIAEQSKRRIEELEAKLGRMPKPFKVVKPFVWGVRWEPGQTLKTVDWEWAFKMVESGYLEPIPEAVAPPPAPPKAKELTEIAEEAIRELETLL